MWKQVIAQNMGGPRRQNKRYKLVRADAKVDDGPLNDGDDYDELGSEEDVNDGDHAKGVEVLKLPERNKLLKFDKYLIFPG